MNLLQVTVFLGAVLAVRGQDPTTFCFPTTFESTYYNVITGDNGTIYVDFTNELWAEVSSVTGVRTVSDFANLRTHVITGQGNNTACQSFKLRTNQIMYKCLPPYAKPVAQATGYLNYLASYQIYVYTFDIPTEYDTVYRVYLGYTYNYPYMPVMSQQFGYHGTTDMYIYVNATVEISNVSVFTLPPDCVTGNLNLATIVG